MATIQQFVDALKRHLRASVRLSTAKRERLSKNAQGAVWSRKEQPTNQPDSNTS